MSKKMDNHVKINDNIEVIWNLFLKCEDEYEKKTYLELFLYEFNKSDKTKLFTEKSSFLSSVPSQLSCYILQMIYTTICSSISTIGDVLTATDCDPEIGGGGKERWSANTSNIEGYGYYKRNLLQESSEFKHVVSLREFLLSGTGGRILETLQCIGVTTITCGRELTSLLINLFPSSAWNDEDAIAESYLSAENPINFFELIEKLTIYDHNECNTGTLRDSITDLKSQDDYPNFLQCYDEYDILNDIDSSKFNIHDFLTADFQLYLKRKLPSVQFSTILLNVLTSIVSDENLLVIDKLSSTIQCLDFGLEKLKQLSGGPNASKIFVKDTDRERIRRKLLTLIIVCWNNIFSLRKSMFDLIDIEKRLKEFLTIMRMDVDVLANGSQTEGADVIFGLNFYGLIIVNNAYLLRGKGTSSTGLEEYISKVKDLTPKIYQILSVNEESTIMFRNLISILIRIVVNVKMNENKFSRKLKSIKCRKICHDKHINHHQFGGGPQQQPSDQQLRCLIENILFQVIDYDHIEYKQVKIILNFFKNYGQCCCNCTLDYFGIVFRLVERLPRNYMRLILNYVKQNFINTLVNICCDLCQVKINSADFQHQLVQFYVELIERVDECDICIVLEHIENLSTNLPTAFAKLIVFDITATIFENFKLKLIIYQNDDDTRPDDLNLWKKIVCLCLNTFSNYVNDVNVIDEFFDAVMVKHLEDLLKFYEIVPNIFCLIKIGLLHIRSDNDLENSLLRNLMVMPINTTVEITNNILEFFNKLDTIDRKLRFKCVKLNSENTRKYPILFEFKLAVVYWNMILQLLRSNQQFKIEFNKHFDDGRTKSKILAKFVYNILNCILNLNQITSQIDVSQTSSSARLDGFTSLDEFYVVSSNEQSDVDIDIKTILNLGDEDTELLSLIGLQKESNSFHRGLFTTHDDDDDRLLDILHEMNPDMIMSNSHRNKFNVEKLTYNQFMSTSDTKYPSLADNNSPREKLLFDINENARQIDAIKSNLGACDQSKIYARFVIENNLANYRDFIEPPDDEIKNGIEALSKSESLLNSVLQLGSFISIGKLNGFLHKVFGGDDDDDDVGYVKKNSNDPDRIEFTAEELELLKSSECKKTLYELFEITLSVMLLDLPVIEFETKMSPALEELKNLILSYSTAHWHSIENGPIILNVLYSLLKVSKCRHSELYGTPPPPPSPTTMTTSFVGDNTDNDHQQQQQPLTKENCRQSVDTFGSDLDLDCSEADTVDDNYLTADEGYDADAENCNRSQTESNSSNLMEAKLIPASQYRNSILYKGICKIIIEILFEFCTRCLSAESCWPNLLHQILTRIASVRESLGGSVFLIRGFKQILEVDDNKLSDLQKSILELITDLNTPDALAEYFRLFTAKNPPVDLLLTRLQYVVGASLARVQSTMKVDMSTFDSDQTIKASGSGALDPDVLKSIRTMFENHVKVGLKSGISQSKLVIPLGHIDFNPWSTGFTVSTWIQVYETENDGGMNTNADADEDDLFGKKNQLSSEYLHLITGGNKKLMVSVFLDCGNSLGLQIRLSRGEIQKKTITRSNTANKSFDADELPPIQSLPQSQAHSENNCGRKFRRKCKSTVPVHQGLNLLLDDVQTTTNNDGEEGGKKNQPLRTTSKILRSISNLNIFSTKHGKPNLSGVDDIKPIDVRNLKLCKNKWQHLSVSVEPVDNGTLSIIVTVDGTEREIVRIDDPNLSLSSIERVKPSFVCAGSNVYEPETKSRFRFGYSLTNLLVFRESIKTFSIVASLTSFGPDFINLNGALAGNIIPNLSLLSNERLVSDFDLNSAESLKVLRKLLIGVYSASDPCEFLAYDIENRGDRGEPIGLITIGVPPQTICIPSLQTAAILCGGISPLLFLFARIVELTPCQYLQSTSLNILLQIVFANAELYTEFIKCDGVEMIGAVIRTKKCVKGLCFLKSFIDVACHGPVLTKQAQNDDFHIIANTNACIVHPDLLISVIIRYWDWYDPDLKDSDVLDVLFSVLLALVREKHPHHSINVFRLTKAGIIPALLNFCKIYLVGASRSVYMSRCAAENLVELVRVFAGAPPLPSLIDEIIKLLVLMHRPSDSFVTHDRSKFYFLLSSMSPTRQKRLSIPIPTTNYKMRDRKVTMPMPTDTSIFQSIKRSLSFDVTYNGTSTGSTSGSGQNHEWNDLVDEKETSLSLERIEGDTLVQKFKSKPLDSQIYSSRKSKITERMTIEYARTKKPEKIRLKRINRHKHRCIKVKSSRKCLVKSSTSDSSSTTNTNSTVDSSHHMKKFSADLKSNDLFVAYKMPGFIRVQEYFFNLLRDFILILPDNSVHEVLSHYVTIEILIVLANHHDINVRTSILNLLAIICDRLAQPVIAQQTKSYYWFHLGNQIALNPVNLNFLTVCVHWITGVCIDIDEMLKMSNIDVKQKHGLNILIAILPQTIYDATLADCAFHVVEHMYDKIPSIMTYMIENGLIYAIIKSIVRIYSDVNQSVMVVDRISSLLKMISFKSFISVGNINILWDILNGLTYIEQAESESVSLGARRIQTKILNHLIDSCITSSHNQKSILNFKIKTAKIMIPGCPLSAAEFKTRFDLVVDRAGQFITNEDKTYQPNETEIKLIYSIIDLTINGHARGSNVIYWGLCPSRSMSIKMNIIKILAGVKDLNKINCDVKTIKIFAQNFLHTNRENLTENEIKIAVDFCDQLDGPTNSSWNLSEILNRMELTREMNMKEYKPSTERSIFKMEMVAQSCIESAMKITRNFVELQNVERRLLMNHMRTEDDKKTIIKWNLIIQNMSHEGAAWYSPKIFPSSWELDHTEGPDRSLTRFKRCHRQVHPKFILPETLEEEAQQKSRDEPYYLLQYLILSIRQSCSFCATDQVLHNLNVKQLTIDKESDGEMIITESQVIFIPNLECYSTILYDIVSITEIWPRRYQHEDIGMEFVLESGKTIFFIITNASDREIVNKYFTDKIVQCPDIPKLYQITREWGEGQLTNWEYLMRLNQLSGRTYHDLMQYPVLPWILADYESRELDLTKEESFRILEKPIAIQHKENEAHYINTYNYLSQSLAGNIVSPLMTPYHYSSHYSNSGTVLHFLVRVLPYTRLFLQYQDNNFDIPDRTFHSINTTWRLASRDSPTDVKEIIPQFFTLPEMFENNEGFNFGARQSGELVNNVKLPPWANDSARLFILVHRQALESNIVRRKLNHWIDLIFGYKQGGKHAVDAINVFHPATYYGFSSKDLVDPVERMACETMIKTYGQMPRQLLADPHPPSNIYPVTIPNPGYTLSTVRGLMCGVYTGSEQLGEPRFWDICQTTEKHLNLVSLAHTNVVYAIPDHCNLMQGVEQDTMNLISWQESDRVVRIKPICDDAVEPKILLAPSRFDPITACGTSINSNQLWLGHKSGRISVYHCISQCYRKYNKTRANQNLNLSKLSYNSAFRKVSGKLISRPLELDLMSSSYHNYQSVKWSGPHFLIRHTDEIRQIRVSVDFKIAVTAGRDGTAVIWDLNNLQYIQTIADTTTLMVPEIYLVQISPTLGDIITVHDLTRTTTTEHAGADGETTDEESFEVTETNIDDFVKVSVNLNGICKMRMHSINGKYINHLVLHERIMSICYSSVKEGTGINAIVTGMENGVVKFWSSWDLSLIRDIRIGSSEIISVTFSTNQHLIVSTKEGIQIWESPGLHGIAPKIIPRTLK